MRFLTGTHMPGWLRRPDFAAAPLFLSAVRLRLRMKRLRPAITDWAVDSGGFSELTQHGRWTVGPEQYAAEVRHWMTMGRLQWAAIQDWMCEPFVLEKTGLSLIEHQRRTVESWATLTTIAPDLPWVPVLQGWESDDYRRHVEMYAAAGTDLRNLPLVGIGSVCRRQATREAERIVGRIARLGISLHLFGFKLAGLRRCGHMAASADSLAWSYAGRSVWKREGRRACGGTHKGGCGNCPAWALAWRERVIDRPAPHHSLFG